MKKNDSIRSVLIIVMALGSIPVCGQNILVTFTGTGAATQIDSVKAANLTTNQSVTLPGNETLLLTTNTGIPVVSELANRGIVYPNPFSGSTTVSISVQKPQSVYLKVINQVGQVVTQTKEFVQAGDNEFALSVNTAGIYSVTAITEQGTICYKAICTDACESANRIQYFGAGLNNLHQPGFKAYQTGYTLGYSTGDIILYKCYSGIYTTIITDSLISSKNYEVEFIACTDPDGKNYSIVKIGEQMWMAENLAWLPAVSPSSDGSEETPYLHVYGYEGINVIEAKSTANYMTYGVLYNWPAAMNGASSSTSVPSGVQGACPDGWHLPSDAEWTVLTDYLGSSAGTKIKATTGWSSGIGDNTSGFTALPGGRCNYYGRFYGLRNYAYFWSSSEDGSSDAGSRGLDHGSGGVYGGYCHPGYGHSVRCIKNEHSIPFARFTFTPTVGTLSTTFQFDATGSSDAETATADLNVRWDLNGDGIWDTRYDTIKTYSCQYPDPGDYRVILEVRNNSGFIDIETHTVVVVEGTFTDNRDQHEYPYITIGTQTWMAENLAYLPSVSPSSSGSDTSPYYYVYGSAGTSVSDAKSRPNYITYGVLYNWEAAKIACPQGWHLPTDTEWATLTDYLNNNGYGYGGSGSDIGKSMASTSGWPYNSAAGTVGRDQGSNNRSGFKALPGGHLYPNGSFYGLGHYGSFWSSTEIGSSNAWYRYLGYDLDGVYRYHYDRRSGHSVRCLKDQ